MKIQEKNVEIIIDCLAAKIKSLETDLWFRNERIKAIEAENEALKGGVPDSKL